MTGWKSEAGYSDDTALVKLYPLTDHKEAWRREAEQRGTSMSQYCQELIQEARFRREPPAVSSVAKQTAGRMCTRSRGEKRVKLRRGESGGDQYVIDLFD